MKYPYYGWEALNQELLKQWYEEDIKKYKFSYVRKIVCPGCGKIFYTQVGSKKYCDNYTCGRIVNNEMQRVHRLEKRLNRICAYCGATFTPERSDGKYCSKACKQKAYRLRSKILGVTDKLCTHNEDLAQP